MCLEVKTTSNLDFVFFFKMCGFLTYSSFPGSFVFWPTPEGYPDTIPTSSHASGVKSNLTPEAWEEVGMVSGYPSGVGQNTKEPGIERIRMSQDYPENLSVKD